MSYQELNGQVVLTLSRQDYEKILMALGCLTAMTWSRGDGGVEMLRMLNRLNSGNPNYTPYQVEEQKS